MRLALALHALAAPLIFTLLSWRYFRVRGARAPLSTAVDTEAGEVFGSVVVRWVCAQTAAPATTVADMTTATSLIWPPFTDSRASFGRCPRVSGCHAARDPLRTPPLASHGKCDGSGYRRVKTPRLGRCSGHCAL